MTDTQTVDDKGAEDTNPNVSFEKSIESAPRTSQEFLELKRQLDLNTKELKGLQSRQDKSQNEVQKFMGEIKKRIADGMSLDEAEKAVNADMETAKKDDLLYRIARKAGVLDEPSQPTAGNSDVVTVDTAKVFEAKGLDLKDPRVTLELSKKYNTDMEAELAAYKLRDALASAPNPTSAQAASLTGNNSKKDLGALKEDYIKEFTAARGNRALGKQIQDKYRDMGLDPGSVGFSV